MARGPTFLRPPVAEVIRGIQFQDVPRWTTAQFGRFWSEIASEYPETEDQSPLAKLPPDMQIRRPEGQILEYPPLRRVLPHVARENRTVCCDVVQILSFYKSSPEAITAQDATGKALQASNMFLHFDWTLPDNAGILSLEVKHGSRVPDQRPVLVLELTCRGEIILPESDLRTRFEIGHDAIVNTFAGDGPMSTRPSTATVINPFNKDDQSWPRRRNCRAARSATVEIEMDEHAASAADDYSTGSSSTAFQDIFESSESFTTINRVKALEEEEEEFQEDRPSPFALETAMSVLTRAAQLMTREFPRGSASVGAGQGVRLTWRLPMVPIAYTPAECARLVSMSSEHLRI